MSRVLIFGLGSIGSVYALVLTRAGADVSCVCRSNYDEVRTSGLHIESEIFGSEIIHPKVMRSAAEVVDSAGQFFDFVFVCTKSFPGSQQQAVECVAPALDKSPTTTIVLLQNGIGVEDDYLRRFPNNPIISGVIYMPTMRTSATSVRHTEKELLFLGAFPSSRPSVQAAVLASILRSGGATVETPKDIQGERWRKIVANAVWNPVCALSRCHDVEFLLEATSRSYTATREMMREVCAVATACGYTNEANDDTVNFQMGRTLARQYPGVEPSMMSDMLGERSMEVEAILGGIVRIAIEKGVSIPRLETMYCLLAGLNYTFRSKV